MKTSESIANIAEALSAAQGEFKNPICEKTVNVTHKSGGSHSFKYATLPNCFDVTRAALSKHGIAHFSAQIEIDNGILITQRLVHKSGEWFESSMPLPHNQDPKLMAGNLTYYRRYLFNGLVGIAGDDDLDDDTNKRDNGPKPPPAPPVDPSEYVMKTSKAFKGKKLIDCDIYALADYSKWIREECQDPGPSLVTDGVAMEAFLKTRETKKQEVQQ